MTIDGSAGQQVAPDYVLTRRGGRPKKTARDVAIFLAKHWRENELGELTKTADQWILDKWGKAGISESAHIRAAVRRAKDTWVKRCFLIGSGDGRVMACAAPICEGSLVWVWQSEMTEAQEGRVVNFRGPAAPISPLAEAVACCYPRSRA